MNKYQLQHACKTAAALACLAWGLNAHAQAPAPLADYPKQAITVVSPFPPGGGNDGVARLIAQELGAITGQSVVVETVPARAATSALRRCRAPSPTAIRW